MEIMKFQWILIRVSWYTKDDSKTYYGKNKRTKTLLKKNKMREFATSIKTYYKIWYWYRCRQINQWNSIKCLEIDLHETLQNWHCRSRDGRRRYKWMMLDQVVNYTEKRGGFWRNPPSNQIGLHRMGFIRKLGCDPDRLGTILVSTSHGTKKSILSNLKIYM